MMTYTEQLEHETEQTRSRIADTLEELRACMTPGQVVNQLADRVGDAGAREFLSNLKRQTVDNPVPVALIGAGLAWLMLGRRRDSSSSSPIGQAHEHLAEGTNAAAEAIRNTAEAAARAAGRKSSEWSEAASQTGSQWRDKAAGIADDASERIGSAADGARQSIYEAKDATLQMAGSVGDQIQRGASAGYEAISDSARRTTAAMADSARLAGQRTLESGTALFGSVRQQPLVLAGLGIAIGAMIGALLPQTETEDRLLGESSDQLRERAQDFASQQDEPAKKEAARAFDTAQGEAAKQTEESKQTAAPSDEAGASIGDEATLVPQHSEDRPRQDDEMTKGHARP